MLRKKEGKKREPGSREEEGDDADDERILVGRDNDCNSVQEVGARIHVEGGGPRRGEQAGGGNARRGGQFHFSGPSWSLNHDRSK